MEYGKIIAITGMPGLYELVTSKNDGAIVRSLDDKTTKFVSSRVHNFSHLESIEVYTVRENVNLIEIFKTMNEKGNQLPDAKDNNALRKYFDQVYPDIDFERVYTSDLKKMVKWYEGLKANDVELKLSERAITPETEEQDQPEEEEVKAEVITTVAPKKQKETKSKKADSKTAVKEETPKKKAAKKAVKKSAKKK
ncbi:MAG TPA: DUF5606 domain-containing protein [Flavitalea sp.]|nr:DUF5606 domain-containing protein [Flavitalea sp.]